MADNVVQYGLDAVVAVVLAIGGGIVQALRSDHRDLELAHETLANSLPNTYARRDDVKAAFEDLKVQHREMNQKLDRLLARP